MKPHGIRRPKVAHQPWKGVGWCQRLLLAASILVLLPNAAGQEPIPAFDAWLEEQVSGRRRVMDRSWEAQGEALAQARRAALAAAIVSDPAMALRWAVPMEQRRHLPPGVTRHLEERVEGLADIEVIAVLGLPETLPPPPIQRWVILPGRIYRAHVHGWRLMQGSAKKVPILGVAVDDQLAVASHPWELDGPFPSPAADGPTDAGYPGAPAAATDHPVQSVPRIQRILFLRVVFADALEPSISEAAAHAMLALADAFYRTNSYGLLGLAGTVTPPLLLPRTRSWYADRQDFRSLREDALQAATAMGFPLTDFDLDAVHHTEIFPSLQAMATVGSRGIWMQTSQPQVLVHELGHNFGLRHANSWTTTDSSVAGTGVNREYGDVYDTMGSGFQGLHVLNLYQKNHLGWLPPSAIHTVSAEGTYRLRAFDTEAIADGPTYALRILTGENREYWLETRRSLNRNPAMGTSLLVRWSPWGLSNGGTQLLDTSPGSEGGFFDAPLALGHCIYDPIRGFKITPSLPEDGTPDAVEVTIRSTCYLPAIHAMDPAILVAPVPGGGLVTTATRAHPASYRIQVPADGSYALWCHLAYPQSNSEVALALDHQPPQRYAVRPGPAIDGWHWARIQPSAGPPGTALLGLTAGSHQIEVEPLQETIEIDQLLLTNDPTTNAPPTLAPVPDRTVLGWAEPLLIPFEVLDLESPPDTLRVSVAAIDSGRMTPKALHLEGQGLHRVLKVVPRPGDPGADGTTGPPPRPAVHHQPGQLGNPRHPPSSLLPPCLLRLSATPAKPHLSRPADRGTLTAAHAAPPIRSPPSGTRGTYPYSNPVAQQGQAGDAMGIASANPPRFRLSPPRSCSTPTGRTPSSSASRWPRP